MKYVYSLIIFGVDNQDIFKVLAVTDGNIIPIMCNQEHSLLRNNSYKVKKKKKKIFIH